MDPAWRERLERDGFAELPGVLPGATAEAIARELTAALAGASADGSAIRSEGGVLYAARNVLTVWARAADVWRVPPLVDALTAVLGPGCGLVRALFFDKPPAQSWALPWHKDLTVGVRDNRLPSARFGKPTRKAGVPHVEAPLDVLNGMLTARVHLDAVDEENGPLKVIPGSHRAGKALALDTAPPRVLHASRGDVLLMRPLVAHCSGKSAPGSGRHRRVLHLEFAAGCDLPDGYAWNDFLPVTGATPAAA
jgi:hypothetical protein